MIHLPLARVPGYIRDACATIVSRSLSLRLTVTTTKTRRGLVLEKVTPREVEHQGVAMSFKQ